MQLNAHLVNTEFSIIYFNFQHINFNFDSMPKGKKNYTQFLL